MITFTGKLYGIDRYNKIIVMVDDPSIITKKINDKINPYQMTDNGLECHLIPSKYKDYYIFMAEAYKYERVTVIADTKRYSFDGKKGTSLILKSMELTNIGM